MIANAIEDGVHYKQVNYRAVYVVPTTTIPPLPPACRGKQPSSTRLLNYKSDILEPNEKATLLKLSIPTNIDKLKDFREGWIYVRAEIEYAPVKEVYRIEASTGYWSTNYVSKY